VEWQGTLATDAKPVGRTGEAMLKGVLLDGDIDGKGEVNRIGQLLRNELETAQCEMNVFELRKMEIAPCQGCFGCWCRTPGKCLIEDSSQAIVSTIAKADLLVFLTPVTFGGYSSELKKLLDRAICLISPFFMKVHGETHHIPRYESLPRLLGVGVGTGCDIECQNIFKTLVERNALNLHAPAYSAAVVDGTGSDEKICSEILDAISNLGVLQ